MALFPPQFLDTVTAIGIRKTPTTPSAPNQMDDIQWIGTGFLYGHFRKTVDDTTNNYALFLVTNKHVVEKQKQIYLKFNSALEYSSAHYPLDLVDANDDRIWVGHPNENVDVAAILINAQILQQVAKFSFFRSDLDVFVVEQMKSAGASEGDSVFVLGFPMGMVDQERQYVICRGGCIARIRDLMEGKKIDYLVDSTVFPGNSGGPVVNKAEMFGIINTKPVTESRLIGIVKSYVPYQEVAVSPQTGRPRVVFEENTGLTSVEPVDHIRDTVKLAVEKLERRVKESEWQTENG